MRLTRWSHSCVALETGGRTLVLDPGGWSEPRALDGADAVLVTHEHGDHVDVERVRATGLPVWAPRGADLGDLPFTPVDSGQDRRRRGLRRTGPSGGRTRRSWPGQEVCANLGYVVTADGESVYHPGDALAVPDVPVTTLLVPMQALVAEDRGGDRLRARGPPGPGGRHPRRPGQRPGPRQHQPLAGHRGRHGLPLARPWHHARRGWGDSPASASSGWSSRPPDFEAAVAFYRDALGLPVELDLEGDGGEHVMILDAGRATLELSNPAQVAMIDDVEVGRRVAPRLRVAFEVDDAAPPPSAGRGRRRARRAADADALGLAQQPSRGAGRPADHPVRGALAWEELSRVGTASAPEGNLPTWLCPT